MLLRKTKILCTIGPASAGVENLTRLISLGMDAARLNFSHSSHEDHLQIITEIRAASDRTGKPIAIIQDLQGPKIRIGNVENDGVLLKDGDEFTITVDPMPLGNSSVVSTSYLNLVKEVKPGNTILLDDGYLILLVTSVDGSNIKTLVQKGGILKNKKGIITPGVPSYAPSLSNKDLEDLKFGLESGIDAVALSFVRSEKDVIELRSAMKVYGRVVPIISKIERYEGVEDIEDIIDESDAIMIARGDLGLEMPAEIVPILQKEIIKKCNFSGKPVIIATQMLESMINNPRPTRAEASDVANAVIDGADCVMLSGETSVGKYPFDSVDYMSRIITTVEEKYFNDDHLITQIHKKLNYTSDALAKASCVIASQINASAIVPISSSQYTAINISKYRSSHPIVAMIDNLHSIRNLSYVWGVYPCLIPLDANINNIFIKLNEFLKKLPFIKTDDSVIIVVGQSGGRLLPDSSLKIFQIN